MLEITIPSWDPLRLQYLVLDVNGTVALDGRLVPCVGERLARLSGVLEPWLVSADTQGTLDEVAAQLGVKARRLTGSAEAAQKEALVAELNGARTVVAVGNGANDVAMLRRAALGMAVMGGEGLAVVAFEAADVLVPDICTALDLLLSPRRLVATLRQ